MEKYSVTYSEAFLKSLYDEIDQRLIDFYDAHKGQPYFKESLYDIAVGVWTDTVNDISDQSVLMGLRRKCKFQNSRKKERWLKSLLIGVEQINVNEKNHPFFYIYETKLNLSKNEWKTLYGEKTVENLVKEKTEEAKLWARDENSLIIEFPAIRSIKEKRLFSAFEADILQQMFQICEDKYSLKLDEFTQTYIDEMAAAPYFGIRNKKYDKPLDGQIIIDEVPMDEDEHENLLVSIGQEAFGDNGKALLALDLKDRELLMLIIRKAVNSAATNSLAIPLYDLAYCLAGGKRSNISQDYYDDAKKRILNIVNTTYNRVDSETGEASAINYLGGAAAQMRNGRQYMIILLGPVISNAIINNQVRRISSNDYRRIPSKIGKLMILTLQVERVKAYYRSVSTGDPMVTSFNYSNFLAMVNFGSNNKHENWKLIKNTLENDFRAQGVFIDDLFFDNVRNTVVVYWIPLTETEIHDLRAFGFGEDKALIQ